ncbi:MAG: accessory factor UbiK family protein [Magnetovibrio sp.]|nr:accessory factor UbiK family protein [Magnetovibrio sp.]
MQTSNNILNDMAKVASGAVSAVTGLKGDAEVMMRRFVEHLIADMDLVTRDEFEAVKEMASKARAEQDKLQARVKKLETQLNPKKPAAKTAAGTTSKTAAKPAAKPAPKPTAKKA